MKVLMISGYIPSAGGGGIERHVYDLSMGLINRGVDVAIACENRQYFSGNYDLIRDRLVLSGVNGRLPHSLQLIDKSFVLSRSFDPSEYDVIHCHAQYGMASVLKNRLRRGKKPITITTLHGTTAGVFNSLKKHGIGSRIPMPGTVTSMAMEGLSSRLSDACIAVSNNVAREAHGYYRVKKGRIKVIYNWVDNERFRPYDRIEARKKLGLDSQGLYLLYTGRTDKIKGYHLVVDAMKALGDRATLLVASKGAGEMGEKDAGNIKLLGYVEDRLLPLYYSACDLFAFPSIYEGLPLTLIEAISCGAVPVCMNLPPMDEVVDASNGYLCEKFDPGEYTRALMSAIESPDRNLRSAECIRRSGIFRMERAIEETAGLYESLLKA